MIRRKCFCGERRESWRSYFERIHRNWIWLKKELQTDERKNGNAT